MKNDGPSGLRLLAGYAAGALGILVRHCKYSLVDWRSKMGRLCRVDAGAGVC